MASDINKMGIWVVAGGHEYQNNGPTACEYAGGIGGIITFEPLIAHYGNTGLTVSSNANFNKIYGPWLYYFNSGSNGAACWADSKNQGAAEQLAWPYGWLTNNVYQSSNQRATVSGKFIINDPLRPQALGSDWPRRILELKMIQTTGSCNRTVINFGRSAQRTARSRCLR